MAACRDEMAFDIESTERIEKFARSFDERFEDMPKGSDILRLLSKRQIRELACDLKYERKAWPEQTT